MLLPFRNIIAGVVLITLTFSVSAQKPLHVSAISFEDADHFSSITLGMSCVFSHVTSTDTNAIFYCSYSAKTAVIKINGKMELLHLKSDVRFGIFANKKYRVTAIIDDKQQDKNGNLYGYIRIVALATHRSIAINVVAECGV